MKNVIKVLSLCFLSLLSMSVNAAMINGSFGVTGGLSATTSSGLAGVTDITLTSVFGPLASDATGDTSDVTISSANLVAGSTASLSAFIPVSSFLNIEGWSLALTSLNITDQTSGKLLIEGSGILTGSGFDATDATWTFSTTSLTGYSMSVSTVSVVPVPAAVWLFGSGLIGLVGVARRKS